VIRALLERWVDFIFIDDRGLTVLMNYVKSRTTPETVACLLEDRRVRDSINATVMVDGPCRGSTALHLACSQQQDVPILRVLLEVGADPRLLDGEGRTPMQVFQQSRVGGYTPVSLDPHKVAARVVLMKDAVESTREAYLIMNRRRVVAGQEVAMCEEEEGGGNNREKENWRRLAAFMLNEEKCPTGVFTNVMDLLLPAWAPLRRGLRN